MAAAWSWGDGAKGRATNLRFALLAAIGLAAWTTAASQQGEPAGAARPDPETPALTRDAAVEALGESPVAAVLDALGADAKAFNAHVVTLSNPFFEGRNPGSRGNTLAAEYIERYMREAGLRPAFPVTDKAADGSEVITTMASYRQPFRAGTSRDRVERETVSVVLNGERRDFAPGSDFMLLGNTANGSVTGPVVFVGYSIDDGKDGYQSYPAGADLKGKIALVLRFEPLDAQGRSKWASSGWSPAASLDQKLKAAVDRGAAGLILVNAPGADDERAKHLAPMRETRDLDYKLPVPGVMLSPEQAEALIKAADGRSLLDLRRAADEGASVVELAGASATLETSVARDPIMTDNVAGVLPGRGALADDYVIIGAHYDHVGTGSIGASPQNVGKMHPGADDNASGTSGLLVLADKLSAAYAQLPEGADARSIMFITFSAEEAGLIGSRWFVNHPPIRKDQMELMINMDMIGRLRDRELELGGVGTGVGLRELLDPHLTASGLVINAKEGGMGPSDHASFTTAGVPVLFFFTGLHREYHTPADVGSTINHKGAVKVIGLAYDIALMLALRSEHLVPSEEKKDPAAAQPLAAGPTRVKVRFGIAPGDYSGTEPGVLVGDVYEGTSAADAGIKAGDLMTSWNGKELKGVEAWMPMLSEHKPGDVVEVGLLREGKPMTVKVTLKGRDQGGK